MKNEHWIILGILAVGGAGYYYYSKQNGSMSPAGSKSLPKTSGGEMLSQGSSGEAVRKLQNWLVAQGGHAAQLIHQSGGVDGIFGSGTKAALVAATGKTTIAISAIPGAQSTVAAKTSNELIGPYSPEFLDSQKNSFDNGLLISEKPRETDFLQFIL